MKSKIYYLKSVIHLVLLFTFLLASCEKSDEENQKDELSLKSSEMPSVALYHKDDLGNYELILVNQDEVDLHLSHGDKLQNATKIGNPVIVKFPVSGDPMNARTRSIWDLHSFGNKIYLGYGNYWDNSGPTDVWAYNGNNFVKEFTVDDEMIYNYFEFENKLFIPGNDATEDWSFGNIYINDPFRPLIPGWIKLRTLPNALHCFYVALFQGRLYASISSAGYAKVLVSDDMGHTWNNFLDGSFYFLVYNEFMVLMARDKCYIYDGSNLQPVSLNIFTTGMRRNTMFRGNVVYSNTPLYIPRISPVYFLHAKDIKDGGTATIINEFSNSIVQDIVVKGNICYIMTCEEIVSGLLYSGYIYSSSDLDNWKLEKEFTVPGLPFSMEILKKDFYIGLGAKMETYYEPEYHNIFNGPESGSIWRIN